MTNLFEVLTRLLPLLATVAVVVVLLGAINWFLRRRWRDDPDARIAQTVRKEQALIEAAAGAVDHHQWRPVARDSVFQRPRTRLDDDEGAAVSRARRAVMTRLDDVCLLASFPALAETLLESFDTLSRLSHLDPKLRQRH